MPGAVFLVSGAVFLVPGAVFLVSGAVFLVPGAVFLVPGAVFLVMGVVFLVMGAVYLKTFMKVRQLFLQKSTSIVVLAWMQYTFDLSPNLSPTRREALSPAPLPLQGRGWGLGLYWTQLQTAIVIKHRKITRIT